jgi:hypothetical protein
MVVYLVTNVVSGKHYVGLTTIPLRERWLNHLSKSRKGSRTHFHNALRKYGPKSFTVTPLVSILTTGQQLKEQEKFWIRLFNATDHQYGYNETLGGDGTLGHSPSIETRLKRSEALKGNQHTKGRKLSVEHRQKLSDVRKGVPCRAATRRKISEALKGNKNWEGKSHSVESRRKMSLAKLGKRHSIEHRRRVSEVQRGKVLSVEHRRKIGAAHKGMVRSAEARRNISLGKFLKTVAWG